MSKILLDECIPRPLAQYLTGHYVRTAPQMGWASIVNGELIELAEADFEVFITVDKGILYQQNLRFDGTRLYLAARIQQSSGRLAPTCA